MKNKISKQIVEHMEFLGYVVEDMSGENAFDELVARNDRKSNVVIRVIRDKSIYLSARYTISKSSDMITKEFLTALNAENAKSYFTKVYYETREDKTTVLVVENYTIGYERQTFGAIVDALERDVAVYMRELRPYYQVEATT